ncbi:MAG: cytochrome c3 family protein [Bacteroidota bacterium]
MAVKYRNIIAAAVFGLLIFPISKRIAATEDAVELWYPKSKMVSVRTGMGSVIGEFTDDVASIQLIRLSVLQSTISLQSHDDKELFARKMRDLFPPNSFVKSVRFTFSLARGKNELMNFSAPLTDPVDLKAFWDSPFFKDAYSYAYQRSTLGVMIELQLWNGPVLNVGSDEHQAQFMNKFAFSPTLEPGANTFYLRVSDGNGSVLKLDSLQFFWETDAVAESSADFAPEPLHSAEQEEFCGGCHTMAPDAEAIKNRSEVKEVCSPCHSPLVNQASSHFPAAEWDCLSCHDANSSPRYALYSDQSYEAEFCLGCHADIQEQLEKKVPHAAAEMNCTTCHDPHGSTRRKLLKGDVKPLCASCHEEAANTPHPVNKHPLSGTKDPLVPERGFSCASCHNPHGSDTPKLLHEPLSKMCQKCHNVR